MATYSFSQLEQLWQQAGGSAKLAPVMAAIALAESSGRTGAVDHDSNGSTDYGLWQINSVHGYNSKELLANPLYNAKAAVSIERSSGLGAWSTYTKGSYKKYLPKGSSGVSGVLQSPATGSGVKFQRIDQGVDLDYAGNFTAVAPGVIVHIDPNFYNGTPAVYERLDKPVTVDGRTYKGVYYAETKALVHVGQTVKTGQPVSGPGAAEIGFASKFGSSTSSWLPSAHNSYTEGKQTTAGADFLNAIGGKPSGGSSGGISFTSVASTVGDIANPVSGIISAGGGIVSTAGSVASDASAVTNFLAELTSAAFWLRALEVVGGGILMLLGLYLLARQVGLGADVPAPVSAAAGAIPQVREARAASELAGAHRAGQLQGARRAGRESIAREGTPRRRTTVSAGGDEVATRREQVRRRAAASSNPASNDIPF